MLIEPKFQVGDRVLVTLHPGAFYRRCGFRRRFATVVRRPIVRTLTDHKHMVVYDGGNETWLMPESWITKTVTQEIVDAFRTAGQTALR